MNIFPDKIMFLPVIEEGAQYPLLGAPIDKSAKCFGVVLRFFTDVAHRTPNQTGMDIEQVRLQYGLVLFKFRAMFRFGCDITKTGFIAQSPEEIYEWLEMSPDDFCIPQMASAENYDVLTTRIFSREFEEIYSNDCSAYPKNTLEISHDHD